MAQAHVTVFPRTLVLKTDKVILSAVLPLGLTARRLSDRDGEGVADVRA